MCEKNLTQKAMDSQKNKIIETVLELLEADDGKSFEEKKQEIFDFIENIEESPLAKKLVEVAEHEEIGRRLKEKFWNAGNAVIEHEDIMLRQVQAADKESFVQLQKETGMMKSMLKEEAFQNLIWEEHTQPKSLMLTVETGGEYVGYCGIHNLANENWEIGIELLKEYQCRGIGYKAVSAMLTEIKKRLGKDEYHVKIDPSNCVSQGLFVKLGAVPYGIAEYLLHGEDIQRFEEENADEIDEKLVAVAEQFGVEPKTLLSHVLEYELKW